MKKTIHFILTIALSGLTHSLKAQTVFPVKYITDANVTLYQTDSLDADLIAYKASAADSVTNNTGIWYFTSFANEATDRVFFVGAPGDSVVSVYFTSYPQAVGWINASKSSLMH